MSSWNEKIRRVNRNIVNHLGEEVLAVYTPYGEAAIPDLKVHFRREYDEAPLGEAHIAASRPSVHMNVEDLGGHTPDEGDAIVIRGITYAVVNVQPDGQGWVVLFLHVKTGV